MGTTGRYSQRRTLTSSLRTWPPLLLTYPQSWKFRQETWPTTYIVDVYLEFPLKGLHQHNLSIYFFFCSICFADSAGVGVPDVLLEPIRDDYRNKARKSRTAAIYFNLSIKHYFPKQKKSSLGGVGGDRGPNSSRNGKLLHDQIPAQHWNQARLFLINSEE